MATMTTLPQPIILDCFFDQRFEPHLLAMRLNWHASFHAEAVWQFPPRRHHVGGLPEYFGIELRRYGEDRYGMRLLWDEVRLNCQELTREDLLASSLPDVLAAMSTDLQQMLDQPVDASS